SPRPAPRLPCNPCTSSNSVNGSSSGWSNPGGAKEVTQGSDHSLPDFFFRMGLMENRFHSIQDHNHTRAFCFRQLSPQCSEQRFHIVPIDVGTNGIREDRFEDPHLLLIQLT